MLVLSRREAEKVLFPNLGITIEITRVQGSTVRLGIDAPKEIRVIRGELENRPELGYTKPNPPGPSRDLQRCLDAANLAIHLAQNQLRQNLPDHAETAMEQALQCIEDLELAIGQRQFASPETAAVREKSTGYNVESSEGDVPRKSTNRIAVVLATDQHLRKLVGERLKSIGFETIEFDRPDSLLKFLQNSEQPAVVVAGDPSPNSLMPNSLANSPMTTPIIGQEGPITACRHGNAIGLVSQKSRRTNQDGVGAEPQSFGSLGNIESHAESQLQIAGVDGLRRHSRTFSIDQNASIDSIRFTAWFADDSLADEFESKNDFVSV